MERLEKNRTIDNEIDMELMRLKSRTKTEADNACLKSTLERVNPVFQSAFKQLFI